LKREGQLPVPILESVLKTGEKMLANELDALAIINIEYAIGIVISYLV
jgi:hypothetical protein